MASAQFTIKLPPPAFAIAGKNLTVSAGALTNNTATIAVTPSGGFTGNVALTATVASSPAGAVDLPTLSFGATSPVTITQSGASTATLTISTTAATVAVLRNSRGGVNGRYSIPGGLLAVLALCGIPARRRKWGGVAGMLCALIVFGTVVAACSSGGGGGATPGSPGTTPGNYTINLTGTSGSLTEAGSLSVVVK